MNPSQVLVVIWLLGLSLWGCASTTPLPEPYRRGMSLERQGQDQAALAAYREAEAQCQQDTQLCQSLRQRIAETLVRLERFAPALEAYRALAQWTQNPTVAARASQQAAELLQYQLNKPEQAERLYRQVLFTYPEEVAAEDALEQLRRLQQSADPTPAAELRLLLSLAQNLHQKPIGARILFEAAKIYQSQGAAHEALALWQQVQKEHPRSPFWDDALWQSGRLLEDQGRYAEALAHYRRLVRTRKEVLFMGSYNSTLLDDAQLRIGLIYLEHLGQSEQATEALETLRDEFETSLLRDDAQWWIAQILHRQGKKAKACAALRLLIQRFGDGNHVPKAQQALEEWRCLKENTPAGVRSVPEGRIFQGLLSAASVPAMCI